MAIDFIKKIKDFTYKTEKYAVTAGGFLLHPSLGSSAAAYYAGEEQRKQAIKDQDNQYVRMRNAAQRAGFNPLTVLRFTGGQGFTGLPALSKVAAFGNAVGGIFDAFKNAPIEKYQKQVRDLDIKQRVMDLQDTLLRGKLMKAQIKDLSQKPQGMSVPLVDPNTGKPILDRDGNPAIVPVEESEVIPKYKYVYNQNTRQMYPLLNPELTESGPTELLTGYLMMEALEQGKTEVTVPGTLLTPEFSIGFPMNPKGYRLSAPSKIYGLPHGSRFLGKLSYAGF